MARQRRQRKEKADPTAKRLDENDLQWRARLARLQSDTANANEPLVTPETRCQGDYRQEGHGAIRNHGASPLSRWQSANMLNAPQLAAITYCLHLWQTLYQEPRVTGNMAERVDGGGGATANETRIMGKADAKDALYRIMSYIPESYWRIFENCIRFDEPIGVSGSRLGFGGRSAKTRAHQVVCFVADIIVMKENLRY